MCSLFQVGHADGLNNYYVDDWMVVLGVNSNDSGMLVFEGLNHVCSYQSTPFELLEVLLDRLEWDHLACLCDASLRGDRLGDRSSSPWSKL